MMQSGMKNSQWFDNQMNERLPFFTDNLVVYELRADVEPM